MIPATSFKFPCFKALKRNMGKLDAVVECNELAVRRFLSEADDAPDLRTYVQQMSEEYGTYVRHVDLDTLRVRIRHLYVLSAYQQAEEFLRRFREEHPQAGSWTYDNDRPLLDNLLRNIGPSYAVSRAAVGSLEIDIFHYYRRVRNRFLHAEPDEERLEKRLERTAGKLREATRDREDLSRLSAPNGYHDGSFDDFILFTRTVKHIAEAMCRVGRPTDADIVRMVERLDGQEASEVNLKRLKGFKQKPPRVRNALAQILQQHFGLTREESEPIIDLLLTGPLA